MQEYIEVNDLSQKIEQLRLKLNIGVDNFGSLTCNELLAISQELDRYILMDQKNRA